MCAELKRFLVLDAALRIALSLAFIPPQASSNSDMGRRPVTVADAIEMTQLGDPYHAAGGSSQGRVAQLSPNGKHFTVVLKRGDLERNVNVYSLLLYKTDTVFENPKPEVLLSMSSSSNREAIQSVKWLNDNETITFLGENVGEIPQVHSFNIRTRHFERLTSHSTPILSYDIDEIGDRVLYTALPSAKRMSEGELGSPGERVITTESLLEILTQAHPGPMGDPELFLKVRHGPATRIPITGSIISFESACLSPDGRYALVPVRVREVPESWSRYQVPWIRMAATERLDKGSLSTLSKYLLLDTATVDVTPLIDAPLSYENSAFAWAPGGGAVVVSGTYLSLDVQDSSERGARERTAYVVEVELPSKEIVKITDRPLKVHNWNRTTNRVLLGSNPELWWKERSLPTAYEKMGITWKEVAVSLQDQPSIEVTLEEDMNSPPKMFVSEPMGTKKTLLLDLNPQFSELNFGKETAITWKATNGHEISGGLYLPVDYIPGRRYPLVIQTHGFKPDRFWIDGPWSSAFAAQPLAGKGFAVLQVGGPKDPKDFDNYISNDYQTSHEAPFEAAAYEGAIDYLDQIGLIDRNRVGIIGFSRTVYHVKYILTHSKYRFAAATVADGIDAGYFNYIAFRGGGYAVRLNGGPPFGPSLGLWLQNAPGFNQDKVSCPIRIEAYDLANLLGGWEWFVGLTRQGKPVELHFLPDGDHLLVKPGERMLSQQGNVDWFSFWLKGEEDPDPRKRIQYDRWHQLRQQYPAGVGSPQFHFGSQ